MSGLVISMCDRTGNMVKPWIEAGYRAVTVDMQPAEPMAGRHHVVTNICSLPPDYARGAVAVFAFPPCTHLASSGARWFKDKGLRSLIGALSIVEACRLICEDSGAPWMLENPVGTLATYWRKPDYNFHPCDFVGYSPDPEADAYTKKTCLWTGGGFVMPDRKPGEPTLGALIHRMPPSADRGDKQSVTPLGFAYAVFQANAPHLKQAAA